MKIHWVSELRRKYAGKIIWVSGSDPTLDEFPNGFEIGKTMLVLNSAYFKFPKATYTYSDEYFAVTRLLDACPEYGKRPHIFAWPLGWSQGNDNAKTEALFPKIPDVHWVRLRPYPPRGKRDDILGRVGWDGMKMVVRRAKGGNSSAFGGYGTCLHACLLVAIMMGGNPINVIGCNHRTFGVRVHFGDDGKREARGNYIPAWCPPKEIWKVGGDVRASLEDQWRYVRRGTDALVEGAAEVGVSINRISNYGEAKSLR